MQHEIFEIQKRTEAWGLIVPFLEHEDQNVQFFGAHTAQVKITRDWDSVPPSSAEQLRDLVVELAGRSITLGRNKIILRKLFVAITSLALRLVPGHPTRWPDWIMATTGSFSQRGCPVNHILDFLTIVGEEIQTADILGPAKMQIQQSLMHAVPMVVQAITSIISQPPQSIPSSNLDSVVKCLEAWLVLLPSSDLTPLIPLLISLLGPSTDDAFLGASYVLQEIMSKSALADGAGTRTLTEPLLLWLDQWGTAIVQQPSTDPIPHSLCKLLVALGDHSTSYFAEHIASPIAVTTLQGTSVGKTRGHLTQMFLKLLLGFTGLDGYYGEDEDESEMTLGFWYLFQEALWGTDYYFDQDGNGVEVDQDGVETWGKDGKEKEKERMDVAKAVYSELVQTLRRKVRIPPAELAARWPKDQMDKFQVYRRDVGDTLLNAYYVLRSDLLAYYVSDLSERLAPGTPRQWEEVEATLHCIMSIQEGIPLEDCPSLSSLFSSDILGQLPSSGPYRVRRTAVSLIGTYATWFTTQNTNAVPGQQSLLMNAIGLVVNALSEPVLCLSAANALQELCDANRTALAPHIGAFGTLHSGLATIPDTEKSKVLQSIASVIQALPPKEEIAPVEAIINPVLEKMHEAMLSSSTLPEEARSLIIVQLDTLTGVAKGLTRNQDPMQGLEDEEVPESEPAEGKELREAREDSRIVHIRERMLGFLRQSVELWSAHADVSKALSDFFKAITSLPADTTLLTLNAGPLLELVCLAVQRSLNAVWLSLAGILIMQLNPPKFFPSTFKSSGPGADVYSLVGNVLPIVVQSSLEYLGAPGSMVENTDVVQDFFGCMDTVAKNFVTCFYRLPPGMFDGLLQCSVSSLSLQERYSLVAACNFLGTLFNKTFLVSTSTTFTPTSTPPESSDLAELPRSTYINFIQSHGRSILRAVLAGLSGVSPRSSTQNLIELLSTLISRCPEECRMWIRDILLGPDLVPSKATQAQREKFVKQLAESRGMKRMREAVNEYVLVARGLDGTTFGYSSAAQG
ncbi:ARM repeat-containing protein [Pterulicium gracile]|uniref:Importin-13 n=1 Tax=Pterulicium gracile TaxID=1884261 RepID=A0A5C3QEE7_9AGAR|nr:ARM repeat-containing protein [Pterula gracilis]